MLLKCCFLLSTEKKKKQNLSFIVFAFLDYQVTVNEHALPQQTLFDIQQQGTSFYGGGGCLFSHSCLI